MLFTFRMLISANSWLDKNYFSFVCDVCERVRGLIYTVINSVCTILAHLINSYKLDLSIVCPNKRLKTKMLAIYYTIFFFL